MGYAQVVNGVIKQVGLPTTGVLKDGRSVSGYNLLDESILLDEGWLPLIEVKPEYDPETEVLQHGGYVIESGRVLSNYVAVSKPEHPKSLNEEIEDLKIADLDNKEAIVTLYEMILMGV